MIDVGVDRGGITVNIGDHGRVPTRTNAYSKLHSGVNAIHDAPVVLPGPFE